MGADCFVAVKTFLADLRVRIMTVLWYVGFLDDNFRVVTPQKMLLVRADVLWRNRRFIYSEHKGKT